MPQLSIIIPVYNVESYLRDCMESVLHQDFSDMEIICVNDSSTDSSLDILQQFVKIDSRIKVIEHDRNRGLSAARNTGLASAAGKYVWFIDSDDMITVNACSELYELSERYETDIVYFNMNILNGKEPWLQRADIEYYEHRDVLSGRQLFCELQREKTPKVEAWRQFVRREFLVKNDITFYDGILHEDHLFSFKCAMTAERVIDIKRKYYVYRQREDSISYSKKDKSAFSIFVTLTNVFTYWKSHSFSEEENRYIGEYFEQLCRNYKYLKNYCVGDFTVGDYPDKILHKIMYTKERLRWDFEPEDFEKLKKSRYIILYGAGRVAIEVLDVLEKRRISIDAVAVSSLEGNQRYLRGMKIYCIDELSEHRDADIIMGVSDRFSDEISVLLAKKGFHSVIKPMEMKWDEDEK